MPFLYYGSGGSPAGVTDAGFGSVFSAPIPGKNLLANPFGPGNLQSRRIDPVKLDYVIGPTGSLLGMTRAQQAVELAFTEVLGKSAISDLGNSLATIQVITEDFVTQVRNKINSALSKAVNQGLITVQSIDVQRIGTTGAYITTRWVDLSTSQQQVKVI